MSVKIPATRVKKSQQAPPAVSPVTTIFYPGDWNFLRTHLASSFIIIPVNCSALCDVTIYYVLALTSESKPSARNLHILPCRVLSLLCVLHGAQGQIVAEVISWHSLTCQA